ncbi:MAG: cytochrome c biogenesis protein CcsA [Cyclobacteriaceae bacterium]
MIHTGIGNIGHFLVILAFISAIISSYSFYQVGFGKSSQGWKIFAKSAFYAHSLAIIGVVITLYLIISNHYFEYHYAYNYTSSILPVYYQISSFWNGQEGSFLLWMFWNAILGIILMNTNKNWLGSMMFVFSVTQVFLVSMILGVVFGDVKIGSSPFLLLRDVINDPIFKINPEFVPADGRGLNPLLQNYWMVIHPPTLFLGFATTVIPFSYAVAGLLTGKLKEWIRPALPWAQFSAAVLGVGILMGAYWAYETLNFGGYWNWDPVENAIYVPWLILVAGIHTMIAYKKSGAALKASFIMILATYVLIVYSTFLTRSGILGNSSVHSFTDLGLSGQLLIYLFVFLGLSIGLCIWRWKKIPTSEKEVSAYSREFWIFIGATTLAMMGFQVIIPTSIPVWNEIVDLFGGNSNLAPPADQVGFYTQFQLYFAIAVAFLSGTGQFFWWDKIDSKSLKNNITPPIVISLLLSTLVFTIAKITEPLYVVLLIVSMYSIVANLKILSGLVRKNFSLSGGSITHIGVAMMLIGILFSSGYSKILSKNNTGLLWSKEFPDEVNQNNLLLFVNEPRQMADYSMVYKGIRKLTKDHGYVDVNAVSGTDGPLRLIFGEKTVSTENTTFLPGDTTEVVNMENSYFEVEYVKLDGEKFTLFPRIQINETMDMIVYSPDINRTINADLYTHVRTIPDPDQETVWTEVKELKVAPGDRFYINDYVAEFKEMVTLTEVEGIKLEPGDLAIQAEIIIQGEYKDYPAKPIYVIKNNMAGKVPYIVNDLGAKLTIEQILPEENSFVFGLSTTQKDWIIIEAVEKPWINILWTGTLLLVIGFSVAIKRRYSDFKKMRDKDME